MKVRRSDLETMIDGLATSLLMFERLPRKLRPVQFMDEVRWLLAGFPPSLVTAALARAKFRLFPEVRPGEICDEYTLREPWELAK